MARDKDKRLFIRLDLDYADHPKIIGLSDAAFRAHITMMLYSRKYETDGILKKPIANRLGSQWDTDVLAELQSNDEESPSLILRADGDYELHGFADMQETRAEIRARTERNRENGAKGGRPRKRKETDSVTNSGGNSVSGSGTQTKAETETETETDSEVPKGTSSSSFHKSQIKPEHLSLIELLNEELEKNGTKLPALTKQNADAARLLVERDGYTIAQVEYLIRWSQADEFWRANIRSMSKLREKADTLRLQSQRHTQPQQSVRSRSERAHDFINELVGGGTDGPRTPAIGGSGDGAGTHLELRQPEA